MIDNNYDLTNFDSKLLVTSDESLHTCDNQGIWAGGGGCIPTDSSVPPIFVDPIPGDPGIDPRDKYERDEIFERPTGMMDRLVDMLGIEDTRVYGQDGKIVVDAGYGNDNVEVTNAGDGGVNVTVNGRNYYFTAEQAKNLEIRGSSGNDNIRVADDVRVGVTIRGGSGDDTIQGGRGRDFISGGSGNDTIRGGRGNDWIHGGTGDDTVEGGRGRDTIYGGSGNDAVKGGRGRDYVHGGRGNDDLSGGRGNDTLVGGDGRDRLVGNRGDDHFVRDFADSGFNPLPVFNPEEIMYAGGSPNFDETTGEYQIPHLDDIFNSPLNSPFNPVTNLPVNLPFEPVTNPFQGSERPTSLWDRLHDRNNIDDTKVSRRFDGKLVIDAGRGNDRINVKNAGDGGLLVEVNGKSHYVSPEDARNLVIKGGSGHDNITVHPSVTTGVTILGGKGDDRIVGGSGNDTIHGGSGRDQIRGGRGSDQLRGGSGRDNIVHDNQDQVVSGGSGDDSFTNESNVRRPFRVLDLNMDWRFRA